VRSVIAMPLRGRKGTHGVIEIFNPRADQMTDYTIAFLHILADHAAIAIENARDVARIQQLTITDDCTGLYNAAISTMCWAGSWSAAAAKGLPVSLAFLTWTASSWSTTRTATWWAANCWPAPASGSRS
jgi:hypothetical protein